jgi:hypothetical protein
LRWSHYHIYIYDHYMTTIMSKLFHVLRACLVLTTRCTRCTCTSSTDRLLVLQPAVWAGTHVGQAKVSPRMRGYWTPTRTQRPEESVPIDACISIAMPMAALASRQPLSCCGLKQAVRHARTIILSRLCSADSQPVISNTTVVFVS